MYVIDESNFEQDISIVGSALLYNFIALIFLGFICYIFQYCEKIPWVCTELLTWH